MRLILHIITRPNDALAAEIIAQQRQAPDLAVRTIDLTQDRTDYDQLLTHIFEADSVEVW